MHSSQPGSSIRPDSGIYRRGGHSSPQLEEVKVWGEFACFTMPEAPVERVSYDVMTPSAARGILEAIYWKPEVMWDVREICVMSPIKHASMTKNEINDRQSYHLARRGQSYDANSAGLIRGDQQNRTQRHNVLLKDPCYIIRAELLVNRDRSNSPKAKHVAQFRRRLSRGACFRRPYLGQQEYAAFFEEPAEDDTPVAESRDLGRMLYDIAYSEGGRRMLSWRDHSGPESRVAEGEARPVFFDAKLEDGILRVPPREWLTKEARTCYEPAEEGGARP